MAGVEVNNISNTGIRSNDDGSESVLFNVQLPDDVEYVGDDTDISDADGLNELSIKENYDY